MKQKILAILKQKTDYITPVELSAQLNTIPEQVSQEIDELIKAGYAIDSTDCGYKIHYNPDLLFPWEFPGMESLIYYVESTDSTMELARELVKKNCPDHTLVIAGTQQKGKGRMTRQWDSTPGGLYFTLILRQKIKLSSAYLFNFAAALALVQVIRKWVHAPVFIKWPNDILVNEKKISGILLELGADSGEVTYLNIGIGLNVNNYPAIELEQATSLIKITGNRIPRKIILADFILSFNRLTNNMNRGALINQFKECCATIGKPVSVRLPDGKTITGNACDINHQGALQIMQADGKIRSVHFGDCVYL